MRTTTRRSVIAAVSAAGLAIAAPGIAGAAATPPGDIPDNQAFVTYKAPAYSIRVPEGWRSTAGGTALRFSDKYNSIDAAVSASAKAPTLDSVTRGELPRLARTVKGFAGAKVVVVRRKAGTALLITYRAASAPNPVTGKSITNEVERYEFWRAGKLVALTLAAPQGSDNVDPWKLVTGSFAWTR